MSAGRRSKLIRTGELDERVAALLARRRAGLLTDDKLQLAAYLGEPAARAVWAPMMPREERLVEALRASRFALIAAEVEKRWRRSLRAVRGSESPKARLVEAASREPRLRRLIPSGDGSELLMFERVTARSCLTPLTIAARDDNFLITNIHFGPRRGARLLRRGVEEAVAAAVEALPAKPRPVWRGSVWSYPQERVEAGAHCDPDDLEAWLCGLLSWGLEPLVRGVVTARLLAAGDAAPELEELRTLGQVVLDPGSRARRRGVSFLGGPHTGWLPSVVPGLWRKSSIPGFERDRFIEELTEEDGIVEGLRAALAPWALGDRDPLEEALGETA